MRPTGGAKSLPAYSYSENAALHVIDGVVQYTADDTKTERREYVTCLNYDEATATEEFSLP